MLVSLVRSLPLAASILAPSLAANEEAKLVASDAAMGDIFGWSVDVSGDTAIVGALSDDMNTGAAYVFVRNGTSWSQQAKLVASDAAQGSLFGSGVAIDGDTVIVGSSFDAHAGGSDAGSAYVFVRSGTTWSQQAKLVASDAAVDDHFGVGVALSGDTAVVGASEDNHAGGADAGSAYVFVRSGTVWSQQQKLVASDATSGAFLGDRVSLSGNTALAGAPGDDAAYVFVRSGTTWSQQQKLVASDGAAGDGFGTSVSVADDTAIVGSTYDDHVGIGMDAGSAYVFVRNGTVWSEQQKLVASDTAANDLFALAVSVAGDTAIVGSFFDDHAGGNDAGSAYVFVRNGTSWSEQEKLLASDSAPSDGYGVSVAQSGDTALVGAEWDNHAGGVDAGSVYVFRTSIGTKYCAANSNSTGAPADLTATGSASSAAGDLTLTSLPVPDQPGIFFHGASQAQVPFGCSFLCATTNVQRGAVVGGSGNVATYTYDSSDAKHSLAGFVSQVRNFQYWYRDPMGVGGCASGDSYNTSNAVSISILP